MQLRPSYERKCSSEASNFKEKNSLTMHTNSGHPLHQTGNGESSSVCLTLPPIRHPAEGSSMTGDVAVEMHSTDSDSGPRSGSRQARANPHGRFQNKHSHVHTQSHETGGTEAPNNTDSRENSSSISEALHFYPWLEKSFPYILIFGAKLIVQHITGISVGIGLLTTFLYANKCIVNQVFLREKCSRLQCIWVIAFLTCSSVLLYYTFYTQALYYSLIFMNPSLGPLQFWDALWVVGITDFIVKFFFMGLKCLVLLVPSFVVSYKSKGYWYMALEEIAQYFCMFVSTPVWFRYLTDYGAETSGAEWHFGVLLALLYLILKLFILFGQWKKSANNLLLFFTQPTYGTPATKRQCSEADDICAICQAEFTKPTVLVCQHVFCEECISSWFNREKTCPLCRTVISNHHHKWKDGATSLQLQLF
ncbi:RING finger and transmembrane domain-containing 1 [Pelobates cultripes]|uniref:E3 ubiquitin-protein ligase RNFT1 n=2 Tax=Pelobates cultripes TaxID=61616 RepID=A0AAD1VLI9_PELCU|nr:RING finger and transmembrane domain-containing 1 [Pelobates cultripes]